MAERLSVPASSLSYSPKVGDPTRQLYPGRLVWTSADTSVYSISFRPAPPGRVMLLEIDGPSSGSWKEIGLSELTGFNVVIEPDGAVLRNLMPVPVPVFPGGKVMETDVQYATSLLSGAMILLGSYYPTPYNIGEQAKKSDALDLVVAAVSMATEAVDSAAVAYDTYAIGKKAFFILAHVGQSFLNGAVSILETVLKAGETGSSELYTKATLDARKLQDEYPIWGALLTRAFFWSKLNDASDAAYLGDLVSSASARIPLARRAILQNKSKLISDGKADGAQIDSAVRFLEEFEKNYSTLDKAYNERLLEDFKDLGITYNDLVLSARIIPKYLQENAKTIKDARGVKTIKEEGLGLLGSAPVPEGKIPTTAKQRLDVIRSETAKAVSRVKAANELSASGIRAIRSLLLDSGALKNLFEVMLGRWKMAETLKVNRDTITSTETVERAIRDLDSRINGAKIEIKKIDEAQFKSQGAEGQKKALNERIEKWYETRSLLVSSSTLLEPNVITEISKTRELMETIHQQAAKLNVEEPGYEKVLLNLLDRTMEVITVPQARIYFSEFSPSVQGELLKYILDVVRVLRFEPPGALALMESVVHSTHKTPTPEAVKNVLREFKEIAEKELESTLDALREGVKVLDPANYDKMSPIEILTTTKDSHPALYGRSVALGQIVAGAQLFESRLAASVTEVVKATKKPKGQRAKEIKEAKVSEAAESDIVKSNAENVIKYLEPKAADPAVKQKVDEIKKADSEAKAAAAEMKAVEKQPEPAIESMAPEEVAAKAEKVEKTTKKLVETVAAAEVVAAPAEVSEKLPSVPSGPRKSRRAGRARNNLSSGVRDADKTKLANYITGSVMALSLAGYLGYKIFADDRGDIHDPRLTDAFPPVEGASDGTKMLLYAGGGVAAFLLLRHMFSK